MLTRPLLLLMAVTTGLTVGGNYVNQPLLDTIARDYGIGDGRAAALVTVAQVSYGLGLLLVVPLGDLLERRRLLVVLALLAAAGHAVCALAPTYPVLVVGTAVAGSFSVAAQILVPFAAELAEPGREGRAVGTVMSGLLIGALLARSVSGALAALAGWHAPYAVVAVGLLLVSVVLGRRLPRSEPTAAGGYVATLRSGASLVRELPRLRTRALLGGLGFAGVSVLFATTTFLLSGPRFGLSELQIGLVGLAGVAGASMASVAGRMADAGRGQLVTGLGAAGLVLTWGVLGLSSSVWLTSLLLFVLGFGLADMFLQAVHVSNQNVVYPLRPDARSRLNSVYMTTYFAGGAVGSAVGSAAWGAGGWPLVTVAGAGFGVLVVLVWLVDVRLGRAAARGGVSDVAAGSR
ncbi:MFS transporter [Kineococcus rhizosphaerae]|uniref:Putative MFS family arabinose efflux permease n=1 Tax=Kineococcus rhizosphaerae TaxID=559628 RepID=A0A2T0R7A4_9ACTN|nr:MFS transporter [Kineococcus rhizosphaerae]PRY17049.1 putative MFS family arabinose efflux permease [Kineococcus rhizosphaerae]